MKHTKQHEDLTAESSALERAATVAIQASTLAMWSSKLPLARCAVMLAGSKGLVVGDAVNPHNYEMLVS
jgi:hypothetical protein